MDFFRRLWYMTKELGYISQSQVVVVLVTDNRNLLFFFRNFTLHLHPIATKSYIPKWLHCCIPISTDQCLDCKQARAPRSNVKCELPWSSVAGSMNSFLQTHDFPNVTLYTLRAKFSLHNCGLSIFFRLVYMYKSIIKLTEHITSPASRASFG